MILSLDTNDKNPKKLGKICWGGSVEGIDCGDQVATWLSWNLDRPGLRLIKCTTRNAPDIQNYGKIIFAHTSLIKSGLTIIYPFNIVFRTWSV